MIETPPSTLHEDLSPGTPSAAPFEPLAAGKAGPVERRRRLSRSMLWDLERAFYANQGIDAWTKTGIPHHATSSPYIAGAYARIVFGFMRDCQASSGESTPAAAPIDIVELGAGHGRFAYLFLKKLLAMHRRSVLAHVPFRYIMADFADRNVEDWCSRSHLRPFVEAGLLDFARHDVGTDTELRLLHSGDVITPESPRGHLAVIANYLFDSLPQDAFHVKDGRLYETLLTLTLPPGSADRGDPLSGATYAYEHSPAPDDYYDDPRWNEILAGYRGRLADCPFHFPTTALSSIRDLRRLCRGSFLLLSADKGYADEDAMLHGYGAPVMAVHGPACFSLMVNYHAIGEYFLQDGGQALHPAHTHESLNVSAFLASARPFAHPETHQAYGEVIDGFGPDDMATLTTAGEGFYATMNLAQLLAYLRLTAYDTRVFIACAPFINQQMDHATEIQLRELGHAVQWVWDAHSPLLGGDDDVAFLLGGLLYKMHHLPEAIELFDRSVALHGAATGTLHNLGLCHYHLGRLDAALDCFNRALELDADYEPARTMRIKVRAATLPGGPITAPGSPRGPG